MEINHNGSGDINPTLIGVLKLLNRSTRTVKVTKIIQTGNGIERYTRDAPGVDDNRTFIKLFPSENGYGAICELSFIAQRVLFFIFEYIELDAVGIDIVSRKYCKETGASRQSLSTGLRELVDKKWLFRSYEPKYYWINLHYFFKGRMENVYMKHEETIPI